MLVVMNANAPESQIAAVCERIERMGFVPHVMPGSNRTAVGITGNPGPIDPDAFADLPGVARAIPVTRPYKLVLREMRDADTVIELPGAGDEPVRIGEPRIVLFAGPCAVEGREMILEAARAVRAAGGQVLRGGAFKPRTSPYSFQGLGQEGLDYLAEAKAETGLPVVTEAVDEASLEAVSRVADIVQIGARNMQNYSLLRRAGQLRIPVLLKRGMSATLDEFLQAAEYILNEGNYDVILCERGVRTFTDHSRNTLDLSAVPVLKRTTHLPVLVDPSHATGSRQEVLPMSLAAAACGADGLLVEMHPRPPEALSDGPQSLTPADLGDLVTRLRRVAAAVDRTA